jgi:branched-chain amino acid transport system ATP-binding protein
MQNRGNLDTSELVAARSGKRVLHDVSLNIAPGRITALIGANGAGKSSLVEVITGLLPATSGKVTLEGYRIDGLSPDDIRRRGVAIVPEGHKILSSLTVIDNLRVAGTMLSRSDLEQEVERSLALFPELRPHINVVAGQLSGGQRQMINISQALICRPRFLLVDELSLGLAPSVVRRIANAIVEIASSGVGVLLIEQFTTLALELAGYCYVLERGRIVYQGSSAELRQQPQILHGAYFAEVKHHAG